MVRIRLDLVRFDEQRARNMLTVANHFAEVGRDRKHGPKHGETYEMTTGWKCRVWWTETRTILVRELEQGRR